MKTYCVRQRKRTECVSGSEQIVTTKNSHLMLKCQCVECGITKTKFLSRGEISGVGFDELIVNGLAAGAKGLFNLGRAGASKGIKSDCVKDKIKGVG